MIPLNLLPLAVVFVLGLVLGGGAAASFVGARWDADRGRQDARIAEQAETVAALRAAAEVQETKMRRLVADGAAARGRARQALAQAQEASAVRQSAIGALQARILGREHADCDSAVRVVREALQ